MEMGRKTCRRGSWDRGRRRSGKRTCGEGHELANQCAAHAHQHDSQEYAEQHKRHNETDACVALVPLSDGSLTLITHGTPRACRACREGICQRICIRMRVRVIVIFPAREVLGRALST